MHSLSRRGSVAALCILFFICYNSQYLAILLHPKILVSLQLSQFAFLQRFYTYAYEYNYIQKLLDIMVISGANYCLFTVLTVSRRTFILLWPILCMSAGAAGYASSQLHITLTPILIGQSVEATSREMKNFITPDLVLYLVPSILLSIAGVVIRLRTDDKHSVTETVLCSVLTAFILFVPWKIWDFTTQSPYAFLVPASHYLSDRWFGNKEIKDISISPVRVTDTGPVNVVLVIGESARADHFHINGYSRQTSPLIEKDGVIPFINARSCGTSTAVSVPCLMTRADENNLDIMYHETSFISIFNKAGYHSYWLGSQYSAAIADRVTSISAEAAERYLVLDDPAQHNVDVTDEQLFPKLERILQDKYHKRLIIVHMYGSHYPYVAGAQWVKFKPVCDTIMFECAKDDRLINTYDNTIVYTDYFLDRIIHMLSGTNAFLVYASDHGESLGENGRFLHAHNDDPINWHIPMFWWASDSFKAAHPERVEAITAKSGMPITHHNIFHSILECSGIETDMVDKSLSLCH